MVKWISENWVSVLAVWGGLCIIIDTITGLTASQKDDEVWAKIKTIVGKIVTLRPSK